MSSLGLPIRPARIDSRQLRRPAQPEANAKGSQVAPGHGAGQHLPSAWVGGVDWGVQLFTARAARRSANDDIARSRRTRPDEGEISPV